jgi:hypothetical protein
MSSTEGVWLSISDYSRYKSVSISTIRRHIKNNILKHREENGKYFIYVHSLERVKMREGEEVLRLRLELELLGARVRTLQEENHELRMLVNLYEEKPTVLSPPELPHFYD